MKRRSYILWAILFVLVTVSVTMAQAQNSGADNAMNPKAVELYNAGNDHMKAGDYDAAVKSYDAALNIDKDYRIYYQKGVALKKAEKLEGARDAFTSAIQINPNFELSYNALGAVYFALDDIDQAIDTYTKLEQKTQKENIKKAAHEALSRAYTKKGAETLKGGNAKKAIEYLTKALEHSKYDAAYLSLAKAYVEDGDNDKAIEAANNALKYRESISKGGPYYYLGLAYKNKGDNAKAAQNFKLSTSDANYKKIAEHELSTLQ